MTSSQDDPTVYTSNTQDSRTSPWERGRPVRKVLKRARPGYIWALAVLVGLAAVSGWTRMALTQNAAATLISAGDTTLKQGTPNTNQGAETLLHIQQGGTQRALVRFDQQALEQAIGNSSIRSAKLRLFIAANGNNWGTDGREVNVHRLTQAWTEAGATWNCPSDTNTGNINPDCNPGWEMGGSSLPPFAIAPTHVILHQNNQTGWVEWDVTNDVRTFLAHQANNYGWIIRKDDEGASGQVDYASRENTNPPQLVVELGDPVPPGGAGLTAISDADVRSGSPNQNQGNRMRLQVQSSGTNRVLVQFDRQAMLATVGSGTLQTAKLRLYVMSNTNNWGTSGRAVNVHRMTQTWTEQGVTWNCANDLNPFNSQSDCTPNWNMSNTSQWPFAAAAAHSIVQQNNQTGWVEWNVTSDVAQILSNSLPNYGWLIRKDNEGQAGQVEYGSRESQYRPELRFTVQGNNLAPQVSAGTDQTITLPSTASLVGTGSDDGLPLGSSLGYSWSQVSGPGMASFDNPSSATTVATFNLPGTYELRLTVSDSQLITTDEVTVVVNPPPAVNQAPQVSAGPDQTITLPATASLSGSASDDGLPAGSTLVLSWSKIGGPGTVTFADTTMAVTAATFGAPGDYILRLTASDTSLNSSDEVNVTVNPAAPVLPPDPVSVAPPLDRTVVTTVFKATEFLYSGSDPIQTGVSPGTITPIRAAVLRGKVITRDGQPLSGVKISILNHPELGQTLSRADGMFDLAVNGGGTLTVNYQKQGLLPAQRQVNIPWQDYAWLPDVVVIPIDAHVTTIAMASSAMQVHQGSTVSDADGSRRATLLIPGGTTATMTLANGTTQPLSMLNLRTTEYTVGSSGPAAMPGALPPQSGYTYAVEISGDEAIAAGAKTITFNQPVFHYVENFLNFPVGGVVPAGYYDREKAAWIASKNGRIVYILSVVDGQAILDLDGSNSPATPEAYAALGITGFERQRLASLYSPGQSLWRVPIPHLTPWDCNWPFGPPFGAQGPRLSRPQGNNQEKLDDPCETGGSIVECENQILKEQVSLTGAPFSLFYASDRVPGRRPGLLVPVSGETLPPGVQRIDLQISLAGRLFSQSFSASPNQTYTFIWDGKDAYGRLVQGQQPVSVRLGYVYIAAQYQEPAQFEQSFAGLSGVPISGVGARQEITLWQEWQERIGVIGIWDARAQGLGGWSLSGHHAYDPVGRALYMGDGQRRSLRNMGAIISTVAGDGISNFAGDGGPALQAQLRAPFGAAVAPDGSLYFADASDNRVRRIGPDGIISTVAGNGTYDYGGDGGPATQARLASPQGVAIGADGNLYILDTDNNRVRRVGPTGIITTVAGNGTSGVGGDGGPAAQAQFSFPYGLAISPDGSLYVADNSRVRRVGPDGIITTVAGNLSFGFSGDGGPATQASLSNPIGVVIAADGSLYIADSTRVRRVGTDGIIMTIAGNGNSSDSGDGGQATQAGISSINAIALGPDRSLYIANNRSVRRVGSDGIITTVAGTGTSGFSGDGGPALQGQVKNPFGVVVGHEGSLYIMDTNNHRLRRVSSVLPGISLGQTVLASVDGSQFYIFDASGRHLRTQDALTQGVLYQFSYDSTGLLTTCIDGDGNVTTIERDADGNPAAIVSPYGQRTLLMLDSNGYLASITNPASDSVVLSYSADGLLGTLSDPRHNLYRFSYDSFGRLIRDEDPAGGFTQLDRTGINNNTDFEVTRTTALAHATRHKVETLPTGGERRTSTFPEGTQVVQFAGLGGNRTTVAPDGTMTNSLDGPDPRWGMQAPVPKSQTIATPDGLVSIITGTRTVSLADPSQPFNLATQTGTISINGRTYTSVYDAFTRTFTNTTPVGRQSNSTVDNLGRVLQSQLASLEPIQFAYDSRGRLQSSSRGISSATRAFTYGYNNNGYLEIVTDPLNRVTSFQYDDAGRVTQQTLPGNRVIGFSYDANGNLTSLTPPGKPQHAFDYTSVDLMNEYDPPTATNVGTRVTTYAYDTERKPTLITRPDGQTIDFDYDAAGRLSALNLPNRQLTYGYNATTGKLTIITDSSGSSLAFTYDGSLPKSATWSGPVNGSVGWNYDNNFRVTSRTINGDNSISFSYDNDGLLTQSGVLTLRRNPQNGLLTGTTLGNVTDSWTYNNFTEPTNYSASVSGSAVFSQAFTRDKLGRITNKTETIQGVTDTYAYGYDAGGRLETVTKNGTLISQYTYDTNGNRQTKTTGAGTETYEVDGQDRLLSTQNSALSTQYSYSANGELQSKTNGSQTTSYEYDVIGNLRHATLPDGTQIDYVIDAQNRRVGKKVNGVLAQGWLYGSQLNPIAELDGSNQVVSTFIYGSRANVPDYVVKGGVTYRIISDHLGSPRLVINTANGALSQRLDYDESGNITEDTNPGFQPFGFAGGLLDNQTKLTRFGARDYDSETGRWSTKDPIRFHGGDTNLYGYVISDPINLVDPSGLAYDFTDVGFFFWSLYDFIKCPGWGTGIGLALDTVGLLPVVPAIGSLRRVDDVAEGTKLVIGRGKDLAKADALRIGEYKLGWESKLPDFKAEWKENAGRLRAAMEEGRPIRDASPGDTGGAFLNAERNLLRDRGWTFNSTTNYWLPPKP